MFVSSNLVRSFLTWELGKTLTTLDLTMLEKPWYNEGLKVSVPAEGDKRRMSFKHLLTVMVISHLRIKRVDRGGHCPTMAASRCLSIGKNHLLPSQAVINVT